MIIIVPSRIRIKLSNYDRENSHDPNFLIANYFNIIYHSSLSEDAKREALWGIIRNTIILGNWINYINKKGKKVRAKRHTLAEMNIVHINRSIKIAKKRFFEELGKFVFDRIFVSNEDMSFLREDIYRHCVLSSTMYLLVLEQAYRKGVCLERPHSFCSLTLPEIDRLFNYWISFSLSRGGRNQYFEEKIAIWEKQRKRNGSNISKKIQISTPR